MTRKRSENRPDRRKHRKPAVLAILIVLLVLIGAFIIVRVGGKLCKPFILCWQLRNEVRAIESENAKLKRENRELAVRRDQLKTDAGAIAEARKLGFVRKGEKVVVENAPKKSPEKN